MDVNIYLFASMLKVLIYECYRKDRHDKSLNTRHVILHNEKVFVLKTIKYFLYNLTI